MGKVIYPGGRSLTHAPLPAWRDLLSCAFLPSGNDAELARPWVRTGDEAYWLSRSAWSLQLVARFRQRVASTPSLVVWVPDYFCNEALRPLRALGGRLCFYPVASDTEPDDSAFKRLLADAAPDLVVAVHYFGRPFRLDSLDALAREHGAWLIEDAAHVLRPVAGVGERGDFVLYSPHKLLPVPDGAVLIARSAGPGGITADTRTRHDFEDMYRDTTKEGARSTRRASVWLAKRGAQKLGVRSRHYASAMFTDDGADQALVSPQMSGLSRRLLARCTGSLDREAALRVTNRTSWNEHIAESPIDDTHVPYMAGYDYPSSDAAERSFDRLRALGLPVMTWPDLPPEVRGEPVSHQASIRMRESRVFLPVHRSISRDTIDRAFSAAHDTR